MRPDLASYKRRTRKRRTRGSSVCQLWVLASTIPIGLKKCMKTIMNFKWVRRVGVWSVHRKVGYTMEEGISLCNTWLYVSMDPIVATDQTRNTRWCKMNEYFDERNKSGIERTDRSLRSMWSLINGDCLVFYFLNHHLFHIVKLVCVVSYLPSVGWACALHFTAPGEALERRAKLFST